MALDADGFLPAAFKKVQKIGKGLKSNGTSNIAESFAKKPIHEPWERLKRLHSCEHFFVDIFLEQADLYSLVFFLDIQTFYQVLFAQVYSVRLTPIYLFLAIRQFCKYDKDSCIKSEKFLSQHLHIGYEPRTYRCLVFALLMRLSTCSTTTLVNTVFICCLT